MRFKWLSWGWLCWESPDPSIGKQMGGEGTEKLLDVPLNETTERSSINVEFLSS